MPQWCRVRPRPPHPHAWNAGLSAEYHIFYATQLLTYSLFDSTLSAFLSKGRQWFWKLLALVFFRKAKEDLLRTQKERDFHRMHHKRIVQEKNKLIADLKGWDAHVHWLE